MKKSPKNRKETKKAPKKERKKKKTSMAYYFTKENEQAIIQYIDSEDRTKRTNLYIEMIEPVFSEMVDKIIYTYRFTSLPNIETLKEECKIWLVTVIDKYDHTKGSKAFSYFSVITKNWFIYQTKHRTKKCRQEVNFADVSNDIESEFLSYDTNYEKLREYGEFWLSFGEELNSWKEIDLKESERRVLEAVLLLFRNIDNIEIFNKKAIYFYIRELTGYNTKQVVTNLFEIRNKYRTFKSRWKNGDI